MDQYLDHIVDHTLENLFGKLDSDKLTSIKEKLSYISLRRGETLFHQNDEADGIYILLSGKLEVIAAQRDGSVHRVGFVNRAETVGEMALLSDDLRSATVVAFRNSTLAKMSNDTFIELCYSNAEFALRVSRFIVSRLKQSIHTKRAKIKISNISFHDSGLTPITSEVIDQILDRFRKMTSVVILDKALSDQVLDLKDSGKQPGPDELLKLDHYINELEQQEKKLCFDLRNMDNYLVNHIIDFSDLAIEFFDFSAVKTKNWKPDSFIQSIENIQSKINYVFCHENKNGLFPEGTNLVLEKLKNGPHTHIKQGDEKGINRIVRYITGKSVGLVLGGGGAKGIAHLGILKALEEFHIPVDYIAGTSMGAIYASLYAKHQDFKAVFSLSTDTFLTSPTGPADLNIFPRYSIYKDKKINKKLHELYGEMHLEDLWLPFYCISSNLTKPEMVIHESGKLSSVIRTSMAVPGLFKPIMINKNVHVDGGVFNNIPIDVMLQKNIGHIIASRVDKEDVSQVEKLPNFLNTLIKSTIANSDHHSNKLIPFVDLYFQPEVSKFGLLNWKAHDQIFDEGYKHALETLRKNEEMVASLRKIS